LPGLGDGFGRALKPFHGFKAFPSILSGGGIILGLGDQDSLKPGIIPQPDNRLKDDI
jgi:hypothetical protein